MKRRIARAIYFHGYPAGAGALTAAIASALNLPDRQLDDVPPRSRRAAELLWREVVRTRFRPSQSSLMA